MFRTLLTVTVAIVSFLFYDIFINIYTNSDYSSVWCHYDKNGNKYCTFHNLCFLPESDGQFQFILKEESSIYGLNSKEEFKNISLSSVDGHNAMNMKIVMLTEDNGIFKKTKIINYPVFLMHRFKLDNTMHVIHDDIFPLFMTYHHLCSGNIEMCRRTYRLAFLDDALGTETHADWYSLLSNNIPLNLNTLNEAVCFSKLLTGLSRESLWFQYGFKKLQGPILTSTLHGSIVRKFRNFILEGFNIVESNKYLFNKAVFISRKFNRKILNENFVIEKLSDIFSESTSAINQDSFDIHLLDPLKNGTKSILEAVQNSRVLLGMHGSAMIYSLFLPQNAAILELFPFGIQPQHVSPIRALVNLPNMKLAYLYWMNSEETNSVTYDESLALLGGINHLPLAQQKAIKAVKLVPPVECCHNPTYLYRMFQDTIVDNSIRKILLQLKTKQEFLSQVNHGISTFEYLKEKWVFPGSIYDMKCEFLKPKRHVTIVWKTPLNLHEYTQGQYLIVIKLLSRIISMTTNSTNVTVIDEEAKVGRIQVWIKCVFNNSESIDSFLVC